MRSTRPFLLSAGLAFAVVSCTPAAATTTTTPAPARPANGAPPAAAPQGGAPQGGAPQGGPAAGGAQDPQPRPYAQVIRGDVVTKEGLFKTHRIGANRLYYEIPAAQMGKELLLTTRVARNVASDGLGGEEIAQSRVVVWERRGHRVLLRALSYNNIASDDSPIADAVARSNNPVILAAFNVEAYGEDSAAVIEVGRLYTNPPNEISIVQQSRGQLDAARSFLETVATFPTNIEVEATLTVNAQAGGGFGAPPPPPGTPTVSKSFVMHWSMVQLPATPMRARLRDSRVGYFFTTSTDYSRPEQRAQQRSFISRWRLEKANPNQAISEPIKPITYYVDPATPDWLKPYVRAGIEDWQPAFESAGFRRAIVAADAPTKEQDPEWSAEDARYSVVRWTASPVENAYGPSVVDPRSGEILEADIVMFHNIMNLQTWWYWTQVGPLDPRAARLPLPDSLQGRLVQFVVAHEVGHTLGLPHNQIASAMYPADSVRSRTWVERMGHSPTIMDYARFNYVAQPEDNLPLHTLIPDIGPYDHFSVKWGYSVFPGTTSPDDERPMLDALARTQDSIPWHRYGIPDDFGAIPFTAYSEAVGDQDAIKSTELGIRNLKRLIPMLLPATTQPLEDVAFTKEGYGRLLGQFTNEVRHVAAIVGGATGQEKYGSQSGGRFTPIPRERQRAAVQFVHQNLFQTPTWLLDPAILNRLEAEGSVARINTTQRNILAFLMDDNRLARLVEYEALPTTVRPYPLSEFLADLRSGLFSELSAASVRVDPYRRGLQRIYLEAVAAKLAATTTAPRVSFSAQTGQFYQLGARPTTDVKGMLRMELRTLDRALAAAESKAGDAATRAHLADSRFQIAKMLDPTN
jgi:hypothetical protein